MNSSRLDLRPIVIALVLVLFIGGTAIAATLSIDDLIALKKAGFSDDEIQREIDRTKTRLVPTERDIRKLRAAGFTPGFIDRLIATGTPELTLSTVRALTGQGVKAEEIIGRIAASGKTFRLTPQEALSLTRAGVAPAVIRALRGGALSRGELTSFSRGGANEPTLLALLDALGADFKPDAAQTVELMRDGVPASVIKKLREGAPAPTPEPIPGPALQAPWPYEHPAGRFGLEVPAGWKYMLYEPEEELILQYIFTPERDTTDPRKVRTGFTLTAIPVHPENPLAAIPLEDVVRKLLPAMLSEEPGLTVRGEEEFERGTLGGVEAVFFHLRGEVKDKEDGPFRIRIGVARKDDFLYMAGSIAPLRGFRRHRGVFDACAAGLRLGPVPFTAPERQPRPQRLVQKYKPSVVMVLCKVPGGFSSGTGFIVREDGYVLTNHHVVWDAAKGRFHQNIQLYWDASLRRKPVRAELVAADDSYREEAGRLGTYGADTALLRIIDPGPFQAMPLAPLSSVELSDPVLTMGFPMTGYFNLATLSLFVTRGVVVRLNRDERGGINSIFTDAKITHGSSGGPCIDLETGAVIGQNTFGRDIRTDSRDKELEARLNNLVGYYGVIPIQYSLDEYPDILDVPSGTDGNWAAADHYVHAMDLYARQAYGAAERRLTKVLEREPGNADAMLVYAACALYQGNPAAFIERTKRVLQINPRHYQALTITAQYHAAMEQYGLAMRFANQAIRAQSENAWPYMTRGQIYFSQGRLVDALRDADLAAEKGHGLSAEPEILAGQVLYAMKRLDEGLARFRKAAQLSPVDLEALMGIGLYYEKKQLYEAAAREYQKVAARLPMAPEPEEALGNCYAMLRRYGRAVQAYDRSFARCKAIRRTAPESLFEGLARATVDVGTVNDRTVSLLVAYLNAYGNSANAHVRAAQLHQKTGQFPGLAYTHALIAGMLAEGDTTVAERTKGIPPAALTVGAVDGMAKLGYGPIAVTIARLAPIGFKVDKQSLAGLDQKLPPVTLAVLRAIVERQKSGTLGAMGKPGGGLGMAPGAGAQPGPGVEPGDPTPPSTAETPDPNALPPLELKEWNAPDGTLMVPVPKGFTVDAGQVQKAQQAGFKFIRFYAVNRTMMADVYGCVFDPAVKSFPDAFEELQRYRATAQSRLKVEEQKEITVGGIKGLYASGTLLMQGGKQAPFDLVFIPGPDGIRAMLFTSLPKAAKQLQRERHALLTGFRATKPRPPEPAVKMLTFRDPSGVFSVDYPKSFRPNRQAMANYQQQGIGFFRFLAAKSSHSADFSVVGFGNPVRTAAQALAAIQQFERSVGCSMVSSRQEARKVGTFNGTWYTGTNTLPDKVVLKWEAIFVPSQAGVMGIVFTAPAGKWQALAAERSALFGGIKIAK